MHDLPLISTVALAFTAALVFGLLTQKLGLSPIVGYLLAGVAIGPHTPGFVADPVIASQLAEVGVILLMFSVGLRFHVGELLAVRDIAVPGAVVQSLVATLLGMAVAHGLGWPAKNGLVFGMALSVASTVVLVRVLRDNRMLDTTHGHVAVGWLVVEDIFTVIALVMVPAVARWGRQADGGAGALTLALGWAMIKLAAMVAVMGLAGSRVMPWLLVQVARLRSRELFTLTVLVMAIAVAAAAAHVFGASVALGAFFAGLIVGRSPVSHQAAADALPMRDAFTALFFASVGMLFDPAVIVRQPLLTAACLAIVMVGKPLAALAIVAVRGYPPRTALTVALGLAQIGEFSFILSEVARRNGIFSETGHSALVACALISITLNPVLMRLLPYFEGVLRRRPRIWRVLNRRAERRAAMVNEHAAELLQRGATPTAVVVGYGPVGRAVDSILRGSGLQTVVVDLNMDTIQALTRRGVPAIYGDAYNIEVLADALPRATHLIITLPHSMNRNPLIAAARLINPTMKVFVRAHYIAERADLVQVGATDACYEEAEAAAALAGLVLADLGAEPDTVRREILRIRRELNPGAEE